MGDIMDKASLLLAGIRSILFVLLACSTFDILPISILMQIIISSGIIVSDIYDGKISRKVNTEENKIKFRKIDTFIDKLGILGCMLGLFMTGKINTFMLSSVLGYNAIIVVGGIAKINQYQNLTEKKISGNVFSRMANLITALFCLCSNNIIGISMLKNIISLLLLSSFGVSLGNHYRLLQKDKKVSKEEIRQGSVLKGIDTSMTSSKEKTYQARQLLITNLKIIRDKLISEQEEHLKIDGSDENQKKYYKKRY